MAPFAFHRVVVNSVEGVGDGQCGVVRGGAPVRKVTISLMASHRGGATASDYRLEPATVTFSAGKPKANVRVSAVDETVDNGGETSVMVTPITATQGAKLRVDEFSRACPPRCHSRPTPRRRSSRLSSLAPPSWRVTRPSCLRKWHFWRRLSSTQK